MPSLGEQDLKQRGASFTSHSYDYRKKGAAAAAEALGIPISATLKTLVVALSDGRYIFLMVPGDREVSLRALARELGVKSAELASQRDTERLTGYQVGGIGPFGSRTPLPIYIELAALDQPLVYFNGGRRGLLLSMDPEALFETATAQLIDVGR